MKKLASLFVVAIALLASSARADDKTITLKGYVVYGRAARPMAVTEVQKLPMTSTLTPLKQPLAQRIEQAVHSNPF